MRVRNRTHPPWRMRRETRNREAPTRRRRTLGYPKPVRSEGALTPNPGQPTSAGHRRTGGTGADTRHRTPELPPPDG